MRTIRAQSLISDGRRVNQISKEGSNNNIPNPRKSLIIDMTSGYIGGAMGIALTHPLDSIRVTKQFQARISQNNLNYFQIFKQIRYTHGFAGFYRGIIPPTVLRGAGMAANRTGYNIGLQLFKGEQVKGTWRMWVVGSIAGIFNGVVDMPVQLLKCRAQTRAGLTKETFSLYSGMVQKIWRFEGTRAFTNGLVPQLAYTGISYALFYAVYDYMTSNGFSVFTAGMVAGTVSWPPVLPLDSLRVRMQCQPYNVRFSTVVKDMLRQPPRQWFTGLGATTLRAAPRWGMTMMAIENCNKLLSGCF